MLESSSSLVFAINFEKEEIKTITTLKGDTYTGKLKNDQPFGIGKVAYADGDIYEGEFLNGVPNG